MRPVLPVVVFVTLTRKPRGEIKRRSRPDGSDRLALMKEVRGGTAFFDPRHLSGEDIEVARGFARDEQLGLFAVP